MENHPETHQSMYLSTIPNAKRQILSKKSALDVSDIDGARSRYIEHPRPKRENPLHPYELEKSHPRQLISQSVNKPSFILEVDDIQGKKALMQEQGPKSTNSRLLGIPTHWILSIRVQKCSICRFRSLNSSVMAWLSMYKI